MSERREDQNIIGKFFGWIRRSTEPGQPDQMIIEGRQATHPWVRKGVEDTGGVTVEGEKPESGAVSILPIRPPGKKTEEQQPG